jgi:hypothetical protein
MIAERRLSATCWRTVLGRSSPTFILKKSLDGEQRQSCSPKMRRERLRCLFKKTHKTNGGLVVLKTLVKLIFSVAALAAAMSFGTSTSRAYGDAPWCAVINIGQGTVYWDCQYPTFEACYHLGNIVAGNRGFCNLNPWPGPSQVVPYKHRKGHAQY